jgi:SAM-dependent methyltransferase
MTPELHEQHGVDNWDDHWTDFGDPALANPANDYRSRLVFRLLGTPTRGSTVLDVGSGQGQLALQLQAAYPQSHVLGIEYSAQGVKRAATAAAAAGLGATFVQRDLLTGPTAGNAPATLAKAAYAVCSEVLEHVDDPDVLLRNAAEYMAKGCRFVVTVPGGPMSALDHHIGHRRHYDPKSLRALLEGSGYEVEMAARAGFPFFNLYRLAVIARGEKLIDDLKADGGGGAESGLQKWTSKLFDAAFRLNTNRSPLGWQIVAVARPCSV